MLKEERGSTKSNCSSGWRATYLRTTGFGGRARAWSPAPLPPPLKSERVYERAREHNLSSPRPDQNRTVRPKPRTRTSAGVACRAAAPEPVARSISGNCVTIGVKSPPSEFQRFPRLNRSSRSPNERPSRSTLAPSSWRMACGLSDMFSQADTCIAPCLSLSEPSLMMLFGKPVILNFSLGTYLRRINS